MAISLFSPTGTIYGRSLKIGGAGGVPYIKSDTAPTSNSAKKKLWFCTDKTSDRYRTLNIWDADTSAWIPVAGTFVE